MEETKRRSERVLSKENRAAIASAKIEDVAEHVDSGSVSDKTFDCEHSNGRIIPEWESLNRTL